MENQYFDRYQFFYDNDVYKIVPGIPIPIKTTDKYDQYYKNKTRLDRLSDANYGSPLFGWLILLANPSLGSLESDIPDNSMIRIPHPLIPTLQDYKRMVENYNFYYGE